MTHSSSGTVTATVGQSNYHGQTGEVQIQRLLPDLHEIQYQIVLGGYHE
jgi:hypothetical protein